MNNFDDYYIGIDPGKSGAIAIINDVLEIKVLQDYPGNEVEAAKIVRHFIKYNVGNYYASVESVHAMPKQGVTSMFRFGTNYGIWKGILAALKISFVEPTPQKWQKGYFKKADGKDAAMNTAARIFPDAELYGPRGGKKDGRADALLIADWTRKQLIKSTRNEPNVKNRKKNIKDIRKRRRW